MHWWIIVLYTYNVFIMIFSQTLVFNNETENSKQQGGNNYKYRSLTTLT